jgi:hypothetical protein
VVLLDRFAGLVQDNSVVQELLAQDMSGVLLPLALLHFVKHSAAQEHLQYAEKSNNYILVFLYIKRKSIGKLYTVE